MAQAHALRLVEVRAALSSGEAQRLRAAAQLSISEVANECGVDQSTVWRWEKGIRKPRGIAAIRYGALIAALREHFSAPAEAA
ncbi:helix-turn-helix domain-containing protein [Streptacidiphilus anmyonensis]|uniref:helix-turn-helix domain-containing protein n=1 Tax=Streptacidiphilus anmyonensis TaxID=405782 RepID=UPI000A002EF1|nr:helix-turn-helix transcriptional regulator [Streptacidiphilus anmyonensis]